MCRGGAAVGVRHGAGVGSCGQIQQGVVGLNRGGVPAVGVGACSARCSNPNRSVVVSKAEQGTAGGGGAERSRRLRNDYRLGGSIAVGVRHRAGVGARGQTGCGVVGLYGGSVPTEGVRSGTAVGTNACLSGGQSKAQNVGLAGGGADQSRRLGKDHRVFLHTSACVRDRRDVRTRGQAREVGGNLHGGGVPYN